MKPFWKESLSKPKLASADQSCGSASTRVGENTRSFGQKETFDIWIYISNCGFLETQHLNEHERTRRLLSIETQCRLKIGAFRLYVKLWASALIVFYRMRSTGTGQTGATCILTHKHSFWPEKVLRKKSCMTRSFCIDSEYEVSWVWNLVLPAHTGSRTASFGSWLQIPGGPEMWLDIRSLRKILGLIGFSGLNLSFRIFFCNEPTEPKADSSSSSYFNRENEPQTPCSNLGT